MTISVRLDPGLEGRLASLSRDTGMTKSSIIKESLEAYLAKWQAPQKTPYELGKDLFGGAGSGEGDLSLKKKTRERISERVRAENRR